MMKQAMKRMGISQEDIDAYEVVIKTGKRDIIISNPQVAKINMSGQVSFQISGDISEASAISDEDVKTVAQQANVSEDAARKALEEANGDLAEAILKLKD